MVLQWFEKRIFFYEKVLDPGPRGERVPHDFIIIAAEQCFIFFYPVYIADLITNLNPVVTSDAFDGSSAACVSTIRSTLFAGTTSTNVISFLQRVQVYQVYLGKLETRSRFHCYSRTHSTNERLQSNMALK